MVRHPVGGNEEHIQYVYKCYVANTIICHMCCLASWSTAVYREVGVSRWTCKQPSTLSAH